MLKKVLLVTPGRYEKNDLTSKGIEDVRWLGQQTTEHGLRPRIVFFTSEKFCMYSALILAGAVESVNYIASLRKINLQNEKKKDFWKQFRDALRTERNARTYLGEACPIPDDVEEIAVVSTPGFGGVFPKQNEKKIGMGNYTCWTRPVVWTLDIQTQILSLSCNVVERSGTI